MKPSPRPSKKLRRAAPFILALLLAIALLPGAALAAPPPPPPDDDTQQAPPPPDDNTQQAPPPPDDNTQQAPPPPDDDTQQAPPPPDDDTQQTQETEAHPDAPSYPSADCIVTHAATPAQLCPIAGGLQYYFIGADGSSQTGPYIKPFSELATLYTIGASVRLYTGSNPFTGKSVLIDYLPAEKMLRISTYYPDTVYDTDKPYTFTVDSGSSVNHEAW